MPEQQPDMSPEAFEASLKSHATQAAARALQKLGGPLCAGNLDVFLTSKHCLRYETELYFDDTGLESQQFAEPRLEGPPEDRRCRLQIAARFQERRAERHLIVAYMTAAINYGIAASPELCEQMGAALVGQSEDAFYQALCGLADSAEAQ